MTEIKVDIPSNDDDNGLYTSSPERRAIAVDRYLDWFDLRPNGREFEDAILKTMWWLRKLKPMVENYWLSADPLRWGLVLYGPAGVGKSKIAHRIYRYWHKGGGSYWYYNYKKDSDGKVKKVEGKRLVRYGKEVMMQRPGCILHWGTVVGCASEGKWESIRYKTVQDLLIVDDVTSPRGPSEVDALARILDERNDPIGPTLMATVITIDMTADQIRSQFGESIWKALNRHYYMVIGLENTRRWVK